MFVLPGSATVSGTFWISRDWGVGLTVLVSGVEYVGEGGWTVAWIFGGAGAGLCFCTTLV